MALNLNNISLRVSAGRVDQFPADRLPQIALSGRSNVGKSSLVNTLLGRKSLAHVSSTPGKTITINFYEVDRKLYLVDLPGYGYARRTREDQIVWSGLTENYFTKNPNINALKLVVQLIDIRAGITADDAHMLSYMNSEGIPYVVVATKSDKPNKTERATSLAGISASRDIRPGTPVIPFSSHTGEGRDALWSEILKSARMP